MNEKAEAIRARALREWANRIRQAGVEYERTLEVLAKEAGIKPRDVPRGEAEKMALRLASSVAHVMEEGCSPGGFDVSGPDLALLRRLVGAFRPAFDERTKAHAIQSAARIIRDHAQCFDSRLETESPHPTLPAPFRVGDAGQMLAFALAAGVHPGFRALEKKTSAVRQLLGRYTVSKPGKPARGTLQKLTEKGILKELNALASSPLGKLTIKAIDNAIARAQTAEPLPLSK